MLLRYVRSVAVLRRTLNKQSTYLLSQRRTEPVISSAIIRWSASH